MPTTSSSNVNSVALGLPPYGKMHDGYGWEVQLSPVPENFRIGGRLATPAEYDKYIDDEVTAMAEILWPRYDYGSHGWVGKAAVQAQELTEADLTLMAALHEKLKDEVIISERKVGGTAAVGARRLGKSQEGLFRLEDMSARGTVDLYLKDVKDSAPDLLEALKKAVDVGFLRLGTTTLRFKQQFQRPRPYQVAFLLGRDFHYEFGATAVTPALVSGHCMQGLFARTYATMVHRQALEEHLGAIDAMRQYCIEIGDRRVYAGVHYPSDSLSSWYGSLRLCHHSFEGFGQEAKDFMWSAIQGSEVYQAMLAASAASGHVYQPLMQWLKAEAERKVT